MTVTFRSRSMPLVLTTTAAVMTLVVLAIWRLVSAPLPHISSPDELSSRNAPLAFTPEGPAACAGTTKGPAARTAPAATPAAPSRRALFDTRINSTLHRRRGRAAPARGAARPSEGQSLQRQRSTPFGCTGPVPEFCSLPTSAPPRRGDTRARDPVLRLPGSPVTGGERDLEHRLARQPACDSGQLPPHWRDRTRREPRTAQPAGPRDARFETHRTRALPRRDVERREVGRRDVQGREAPPDVRAGTASPAGASPRP